MNLLRTDWTFWPVQTRLWRKNRSPGPSGDCFGTDLNRNFDANWGSEFYLFSTADLYSLALLCHLLFGCVSCISSRRSVIQLLQRHILRDPAHFWARGSGCHLLCRDSDRRLPVFPHHSLLRPAAPGSLRTPRLHRPQLRWAGIYIYKHSDARNTQRLRIICTCKNPSRTAGCEETLKNEADAAEPPRRITVCKTGLHMSTRFSGFSRILADWRLELLSHPNAAVVPEVGRMRRLISCSCVMWWGFQFWTHSVMSSWMLTPETSHKDSIRSSWWTLECFLSLKITHISWY